MTARTKREALARLDRLRAEVRAGQPAPNRNTTVAEVVELWRERELAGRRLVPGVRERYEWHCRIITTELEGKRVARLTIADVERMLDALARGGVATTARVGRSHGPRSANSARPRSRSSTRGRREMVTRNVAELAGMTPANNATRPRQSLTPEDARRLFDWLGADGAGEHLYRCSGSGCSPDFDPASCSGCSGTTSISSGAFSSSVTGCEWKGTEPSSCRCSRHPVLSNPRATDSRGRWTPTSRGAPV